MFTALPTESDVLLNSWSSGKVETHELSEQSLETLTRAFAAALQPSDWLLLEGDLGAGKTTFVNHLLHQFCPSVEATSPTFSILNVLELGDSSNIKQACHLDLYRLRHDEELIHLGLELHVNNSSLVLVEWSENVSPHGWMSFFNTTQCRRPRRIGKVSIDSIEQTSLRRYTFSWIRMEDFLGSAGSL